MGNYKNLVFLCALTLTSCASVPANIPQVHILFDSSTLVAGCKKLGSVYTDTRGSPFNFNEVAYATIKKQAYDKYQADTVAITNRELLAAGRVVLDGVALRCYP
jgi:hypothetical protein